jgi:hypothetical protein
VDLVNASSKTTRRLSGWSSRNKADEIHEMDLASRGGSRKPRAVDGRCVGLVPAVSDSTSTFAPALSNSSSAFSQLFTSTASRASNTPHIYAHATVTIVTWSPPPAPLCSALRPHIRFGPLARSRSLSLSPIPRRSTFECARCIQPSQPLLNLIVGEQPCD